MNTRVLVQRAVQLLVALVMMVMLGGGLGTATAARGGTSLSLGGHAIAWGGDWSLEEDSVVQESGFSFAILTNQSTLTVFGLSFFPTGNDLVAVRDAMIDGVSEGSEATYQTIDSGSYDNVAYQLDKTKISGKPVGVFTVLIDREAGSDATGLVYFAPIDSFGVSMQSAQAEITVDGDPVLQGIDGPTLQQMLGSAPSSAASGSSGTSASKPQGSSNTSETSRSRQSSGNSTSSATAYTDPTWGYTVTYGGPWSTRGDLDAGDFAVASSSPLAVIAFVGIDGSPFIGYDMATVANLIGGELVPAGAHVLRMTSDSNQFLIAYEDGGKVFVQVLTLTSYGVAVLTTLVTSSSDASDVIATARDTVLVDGEPLFHLW